MAGGGGGLDGGPEALGAMRGGGPGRAVGRPRRGVLAVRAGPEALKRHGAERRDKGMLQAAASPRLPSFLPGLRWRVGLGRSLDNGRCPFFSEINPWLSRVKQGHALRCCIFFYFNIYITRIELVLSLFCIPSYPSPSLPIPWPGWGHCTLYN